LVAGLATLSLVSTGTGDDFRWVFIHAT